MDLAVYAKTFVFFFYKNRIAQVPVLERCTPYTRLFNVKIRPTVRNQRNHSTPTKFIGTTKYRHFY